MSRDQFPWLMCGHERAAASRGESCGSFALGAAPHLPISGTHRRFWVCWFAMIRVVLHAPVGGERPSNPCGKACFGNLGGRPYVALLLYVWVG